ncbi:unnamed protein product [Cylindrotheca closterium]|uniref:Calcineurin-like phosphoesterase domain-containing protein n=1 Tax=Cylindrotheca closterium TaxID=2856 RepID=A0AAD2JHK0_9STRA|nr:unnamed protein product [Cylindrotheca closterium]
MLIGRWVLFLLATKYKDVHNAIQRIKNSNDGTVWIDVENVRGKSGFEMDHHEVLNKTSRWTKHHGLEGKVIAVVDHGSETTAVYLNDLDIAVTFSGREKADDVIANAVGRFDASIVVTADGGLRSRCTRAGGKNVINIDPVRFIDDLEATSEGDLPHEMQNTEQDSPGTRSDMERRMEEEIKIRAQLLDAEIQLGKKKKATNKRKKKLQAKIANLRTRLASRGKSLLHEMTDVSMSETADPMEQEKLLARWQELRQKFSRREQTGDRIILAEWLRRQLVTSSAASTEFAEAELSPARAFVRHLNQGDLSISLQNEAESEASSNLSSQPGVSTFELLSQQKDDYVNQDEVKMTVVSDTHGFESQLTNDGTASTLLPETDLLLHLGDFAVDSYKSKERGLEDFDKWLAMQPHKYKIVVRGNHDPLKYDFPISGAWYITEPCTATIENLTLGFVPYAPARKLAASGKLPKECDVFVSHIPPFKVLDRTLTKQNVGSSFLSKVVRSMKGKATPRLWLCGHIHEARGQMKQKFGDSVITTVVNAANANSGRATGVVHGPITICINTTDSTEIGIKGLGERHRGQLEPIPSHFQNDQQRENELLLAVDLGLKTGFALFNKQGQLLRYEQHLFHKDKLDEEIKTIVDGWESDMQAIEAIGSEEPLTVTKIAVEGGDIAILNAWESATKDVSITRISPEEWRFHLLSEKERTSGATSKAAARLIARQVVSDFGIMGNHQGKFKTDVAEAVVLGFYVCKKLGWVTRDPVVRRYTNGNVVVPR